MASSRRPTRKLRHDGTLQARSRTPEGRQQPLRRRPVMFSPRDWQTERFMDEALRPEQHDSEDSDADWDWVLLHPNERWGGDRVQGPSDRDSDQIGVHFHQWISYGALEDDDEMDSEVELPERPTFDDHIDDGERAFIPDDDPIELMNCWTAAGQVRNNQTRESMPHTLTKDLFMQVARHEGATPIDQPPVDILAEVASHLDDRDHLNLVTALFITIPRHQPYYRYRATTSGNWEGLLPRPSIATRKWIPRTSLAAFTAEFPHAPRSTSPHPDTQCAAAAAAGALLTPAMMAIRDTGNAIARTLLFRACGSDRNLWLARKLVELYPLRTLLPPPRSFCSRDDFGVSPYPWFAPHIPGDRRCLRVVGAYFTSGLPINPWFLHPVVGAVNMAVANDSRAILTFLLSLPIPYEPPADCPIPHRRRREVMDMDRADALVLAAKALRRVGAHGAERVRRCVQLLLSNGMNGVARRAANGYGEQAEFVSAVVMYSPSVAVAERLVETALGLGLGYKIPRTRRQLLLAELGDKRWAGLVKILAARTSSQAESLRLHCSHGHSSKLERYPTATVCNDCNVPLTPVIRAYAGRTRDNTEPRNERVQGHEDDGQMEWAMSESRKRSLPEDDAFPDTEWAIKESLQTSSAGETNRRTFSRSSIKRRRHRSPSLEAIPDDTDNDREEAPRRPTKFLGKTAGYY
ncbi:hypothetical protein FN846DRAFT_890916 [Sphaerosporella brunnea]|uniref:Uncharacterized protein n=1 Tax=Sphaerosporella brunnea TaxID=1250544 RepID=A0A5J5EU97_9PEZI|nr:hypothetical protein FN846DRAFT_890916 [Sphaerosporella brunnea]